MSTQIAKLENELGLQLFERGPRTPTPTVNGRAIIPRRKSYWTRGLLARGATAGLLDRWRAGSLDAAILSLPLDSDDLHWDTLLGEPIVEAVPRCAAR